MFKWLHHTYNIITEWNKGDHEFMIKYPTSVLSLNSGEQGSLGEFEMVHEALKDG